MNAETIDAAVLAWADDYMKQKRRRRKPGEYQVSERYLPPRGAKATKVMFAGYIGCYSSYTCDYGVDVEIEWTLPSGRMGTTVATDWDLPRVLRALPAYLEVEEEMTREHDHYHGHYEED